MLLLPVNRPVSVPVAMQPGGDNGPEFSDCARKVRCKFAVKVPLQLAVCTALSACRGTSR